MVRTFVTWEFTEILEGAVEGHALRFGGRGRFLSNLPRSIREGHPSSLSPAPAVTGPGKGQAVASDTTCVRHSLTLAPELSPGRPTWRPWPQLQGPELGCRSRRLGHAWSPRRGPARPKYEGHCCPSACTARPAAAAPGGQVARGSCRLRGRGQRRDKSKMG